VDWVKVILRNTSSFFWRHFHTLFCFYILKEGEDEEEKEEGKNN